MSYFLFVQVIFFIISKVAHFEYGWGKIIKWKLLSQFSINPFYGIFQQSSCSVFLGSMILPWKETANFKYNSRVQWLYCRLELMQVMNYLLVRAISQIVVANDKDNNIKLSSVFRYSQSEFLSCSSTHGIKLGTTTRPKHHTDDWKNWINSFTNFSVSHIGFI